MFPYRTTFIKDTADPELVGIDISTSGVGCTVWHSNMINSESQDLQISRTV
ncbi:hypothetical protein M413DRAFT_32688 [Hebeloma cylindrosporum]|uniref:Uncharacterized protein n=1 Tax=Hebeloma cylindrosporum TaxID=76867 RepID=A0A0C2XB14_HEBCY|nr:hypothetical protein M413DRAFT_32688 [Hebeloma cylindrosporum h7]